jgi:hypothetical protein
VPTKVHLWHDKTTLMKVVEGGERWTYAWTRSMNNSMHFESLESQDLYRLKPDSRMAREFEDSVKEVVKAEPQYAVPFSKAMAMTWLADLTRHTVYDNGMNAYAQKVVDALYQANYKVLAAVLREVADLPTFHVKGLAGAEIKERVALFVGFLEWYSQEAKKDYSLYKMNVKKAMNIGISVTTGRPWNARAALDSLFYNPKRSPAQTEALMKKAWTEGLKRTDPMPEPKRRGFAFLDELWDDEPAFALAE